MKERLTGRRDEVRTFLLTSRREHLIYMSFDDSSDGDYRVRALKVQNNARGKLESVLGERTLSKSDIKQTLEVGKRYLERLPDDPSDSEFSSVIRWARIVLEIANLQDFVEEERIRRVSTS